MSKFNMAKLVVQVTYKNLEIPSLDEIFKVKIVENGDFSITIL